MAKLEQEIQDLMAKYSNDWIKDYQKKNEGATFDWNARTAAEFASVPIETLVRDPYFLGFGDKVYDGVLEDIVQLFEERKRRTINLAIFLEGIGSGKTVKSSIITWLQWFELSLIVDPQNFFDLAPKSVIALINMNRTEKQAKKVTFSEVFTRFQSPFNQDYFPVSDRYTTEIRIPRNNTTIFPGTSSALSILGYNLYGGVIDEAAFLEVIEDSSKSADATYDAAEAMYFAIINRMISRFMKAGKIPGMICMISSPNFPDDFIHRKIKLAQELGDESGIFWRRRATWEAKGKKYYPEEEYFYIDVDNAEVIEDPSVIKLLNEIQTENFPLEHMEYDRLSEVSLYFKPETDNEQGTKFKLRI